jgi:GDP/UDP-N,N'-diacetylbacillosamine 2-epimerase (hydrolysing)
MNPRKKIGVFTGTRAEYGLLFPVIRALHQSAAFELSLYVSGSHLDERYGRTITEIERDGFPVAKVLPLPAIGENMAQDSAAVTAELAAFLAEPANRPDCVLVLGDRYETLGVAVAVFLSNIALGHLHGGDVVGGGVLDDSIRHAVTKLSHLHFPVTPTSAERILKMGEEPWRVTVTGSPALDNLKLIPALEKQLYVAEYGLDPAKEWVLFTMHPLTTEPEQAGRQAREVLEALARHTDRIEVLATYPNHDEGSKDIIAELEAFRAKPGFHVVKSLGRERYLNILRHVTLVIGNSSSGLLETAFFKVPCVNVGERQAGRERGNNVADVPQEAAAIRQMVDRVLRDDAYRLSLRNGEHPFGDGHCAKKILAVLSETAFDATLLQKQITY